MTTLKVISTYIAAGYPLAKNTNLYITPTGGVGGTGVYAKYNATITNEGRIDDTVRGPGKPSPGVRLDAGGSLTNGSTSNTGAMIEGNAGVYAVNAAVVIANFGTIRANASIYYPGDGIYLAVGGNITNGSTTDRTALVEGNEGIVVGSTTNLGAVSNYGTILGQGSHYSAAVALRSVAYNSVTNGSATDVTALIQGGAGVNLGGPGSVANFGAIVGSGSQGVVLYGGGNVTNGAATDPGASITGYNEGVWIKKNGAVVNYGVIAQERTVGAGNAAVELGASGAVTNGATGDAIARIQGAVGVNIAGLGSVANFGAIVGSTDQGVVLYGGGNVTNGAVTDTGASITGDFQGVGLAVAGTVRNFGAISGTGAKHGNTGVELNKGGSLLNGATTDLTAAISGYTGVLMGGLGRVYNYGTVDGLGASFGESGVALMAGGDVYNGGPGLNREALIAGESGVIIKSGPGVVLNAGTILGIGNFGVELYAGGQVVNGSPNNSAALIEGYSGLGMVGGSAANFGVISSTADQGIAVGVESGATITNGAAGHAGALIEGWQGVNAQSGSTVTNFGTIDGSGGTAVRFSTATGVLNVEAGSRFVGAVYGAGATLVLASGTGAATFLAGDTVAVSGSMPITTFTNFGTVEIGVGATMAANGAIAAGQAVIDNGALTVAGTLTSAGSLTIGGKLAGAGTLAVTGGKAVFAAGTSLTIAKVTESGATTVVTEETANPPLSYAGVWTQSAGILTVTAGTTLTFTGAANSFSGTLAGSGGTVAFKGGADSLIGTKLTVSQVTSTGTALTLSGAIANDAVQVLISGTVTVAAAGASLTGTGQFNLTGSKTNEIIGATAASKLTVDQELSAAGLIGAGRMTLSVLSVGQIASGAGGLTIDTGANVIANAGVIEAVGSAVTIASAVDNTGTLSGFDSLLTIDGAVTGTGIGQVGVGTLKIAATATFNQNVDFISELGTLELAHGQTYSGTISGFPTAPNTFIDLDDIAFISGTTKATYAGTNVSGVLTVTDGTHTAKIHFTGDYIASTWTVSAGPSGGTKIVDPLAQTHIAPGPHLHPFIAAVAGFGAPGAGPISHAAEPWRPPLALAAPRSQIA